MFIYANIIHELYFLVNYLIVLYPNIAYDNNSKTISYNKFVELSLLEERTCDKKIL